VEHMRSAAAALAQQREAELDRIIADLRQRLGEAEQAIDQLSLRCGFPIVEDRVQVLGAIGNRVTKLASENAELQAEVSRLKAELKPFQPMSIEEAERAFDEAEAVPTSDEEINGMVKYATDPEYRSEQLYESLKKQSQIARGFKAEVSRLQFQLADLQRQLGEAGETIAKLACKSDMDHPEDWEFEIRETE
jgi:uncharacterized protein involved in exopolysaccharide biosynthesis